MRLHTMTIKVWYKVDDASPSKVKVEDDADVDDLKEAIKKKWGDRLPWAVDELKVFTADGTSELQPDASVPTDTTCPKPLVVVTPQPASARVERIPEHYVPVLLSLAVGSMKRGWEKISSERTKSESSIARNNSVSHYGLGSRRTCQILGANTGHVKNAHIWPHNNSEALVLVDLQPADIDDPRNVLRLHEDIEYYLDRFHLTLVPSGTDFVLKVLDCTILPSRLKGRDETFGDIDGRTLQCPSGNIPWRRLLATHSILAHQKAREKAWLTEDQFTAAETNAHDLMEFSLDPEAQDRVKRFLNSMDDE